jgi:hypothetical protein
MKLRIRGDSLRLRLTRSEVAALAAGQPVIEKMRVACGVSFEYRLSADGSGTSPQASMEQGALVVRLPPRLAAEWAGTETVGIEATQANGASEGLHILVEKDFPCLTPRPHEDDSDAFARPGDSQPPKCATD